MKIKHQKIDNDIAIISVNGEETLQLVPCTIPSKDHLLIFEEKAVEDHAVIFPLFVKNVLDSEQTDPVPYIYYKNKMFNSKFKHINEYIIDTWNFLYFQKIDDIWQLAGASTQLETFPYGKLRSLSVQLGVIVKKPIAELEKITPDIYKVMPTDYFCAKYKYKKPDEPFKDRIEDIENFFEKF